MFLGRARNMVGLSYEDLEGARNCWFGTRPARRGFYTHTGQWLRGTSLRHLCSSIIVMLDVPRKGVYITALGIEARQVQEYLGASHHKAEVTGPALRIVSPMNEVQGPPQIKGM